MAVPDPACRLASAAATLDRATLFLADAPEDWPPRVNGNALAELDRFLSLLIDAAAAVALPDGGDQPALARQRNTPNKLRTLLAGLGQDSPDHERLRAIGRRRAAFRHRGHRIVRGELRAACLIYEANGATLLGLCDASLTSSATPLYRNG